MAKNQKSYTPEFKQQIVDLYNAIGYMTPQQKTDEDGLFNGYGCPPCPKCGSGRGVSPSDGDFKCNICGNEFRRYGNGGLHLGMISRCPKCG